MFFSRQLSSALRGSVPVMSVSPGVLVEEVIAEEPEECPDEKLRGEEEDFGAGDELCGRLTLDSEEEGHDLESPDTLKSPTTSRIPVWVRQKGEL